MKNKLRTISIASVIIIVISYVLFILPGQFIGLFQNGQLFVGNGVALSGYEYIFHVVPTNPNGVPYNFATGHQSGTGITALIFMLLSLASFIFYKKSTALPLLGGILNIISGFFLLMTTPFAHLIYRDEIYWDCILAMWVPYLTGALILLSGIIAIVISIFELKKEKATLASKGGYNYLKK